VNQDFEPLDVPMYSPAMASRLVGLEPSRVRRWLQGYEYTYQHASFVDLIDLLFVKKFVFDLYEGEGRNIGRVSAWLDLPPNVVHHAVEFEQALAAA
jgi:hypothetical protein